MPSFDAVSKVDTAELTNAVDQASREIGQRYDFKGITADITLNMTDKTLTLIADDEFKMNALWEIVQTRLVRRGVVADIYVIGFKPTPRIFWLPGLPLRRSRARNLLLKAKCFWRRSRPRAADAPAIPGTRSAARRFTAPFCCTLPCRRLMPYGSR